VTYRQDKNRFQAAHGLVAETPNNHPQKFASRYFQTLYRAAYLATQPLHCEKPRSTPDQLASHLQLHADGPYRVLSFHIPSRCDSRQKVRSDHRRTARHQPDAARSPSSPGPIQASYRKELKPQQRKPIAQPLSFLALRLDVSSEEAVADAAAQVGEKFGPLDILVNNAGTSNSMVPFLDSNTEEWWGTWKANATGVYS
jgi:NAD(P)-dependent dehydrogenase (short-subunit alcohol dehydrogenase family)